MSDERPEVGTLARAYFTDGSGSELALYTVDGWVAERGPIRKGTESAYRFMHLSTELPKNHPLRCASCGTERATTTVILEGFRVPVCLRHYNIWKTPDE